jgi:hypothetical protein
MLEGNGDPGNLIDPNGERAPFLLFSFSTAFFFKKL